MKCPKCKSKNIIPHTDKNLRAEQKILHQCTDCNHQWKTDWIDWNKVDKACEVTLEKDSFKNSTDWDEICNYLGISLSVDSITLFISDFSFFAAIPS